MLSRTLPILAFLSLTGCALLRAAPEPVPEIRPGILAGYLPTTAGTFACALDAQISEAETPHLYLLIRRTLADAGLATYSAKNHYKRKRPFVAHDGATCTPQGEAIRINDG